MVMNGAGMNGNVMSYGYVVADMGRTSLVGYMYTTAILDVCTVANGYRSHIATNHCIEPNAALVTHRNITNYRGILAKIAISPPFGGETAITFYQSHTSED
jgi:hypothetical protein